MQLLYLQRLFQRLSLIDTSSEGRFWNLRPFDDLLLAQCWWKLALVQFGPFHAQPGQAEVVTNDEILCS